MNTTGRTSFLLRFQPHQDFTLNAKKHSLFFSSSNAALCIIGLSVCSIGSPITAQTRVFPEITILFVLPKGCSSPHFLNVICPAAVSAPRERGRRRMHQTSAKDPRNLALLSHTRNRQVLALLDIAEVRALLCCLSIFFAVVTILQTSRHNSC